MNSSTVKKCVTCGKEFSVYPSRMGAKFCSPTCCGKQQRKEPAKVRCHFCKKQFERQPHMVKMFNFCDPKCVADFRREEYQRARREPAEKKRKLKERKKGIWTSKVADTRFSIWIRTRDTRCFFGCGRPAKQASHFWGRGNSGTRYDPLNVDGACGKCHMENEGNKQGLYRDLKIKQLGMKAYIEMEKRARGTTKRSDAIAQCIILLSPVSPSVPIDPIV